MAIETGGMSGKGMVIIMALKVWKEVPTDTTYTTATNWVGGVAPVNGDEVLISQGSGNIDGSDQSATTLAGVTISSGYTGTIGVSGTPLQLDTPTFIYNGQGDHCWIGLQDAGGSTVDCRILGTKSTAEADFPLKGLHINADGAEDLSPFIVEGGYVEQETSGGAGDIKGVEISGGSVFLIDLDGSAALAISGGTCSCAVGTTGQLMVAGGTWTQTGGSITTVNVFTTGTLDWQGSGAITTGKVRGTGVLTFNNLKVAATMNTIDLFGSASLKIQNGIKQPAFTTLRVRGSGVTIDSDPTYNPTITYI